MYSDRVCEVCSFNSEHTSLTSRNPHTDKNNAIEWCVKIGFRILGVRQQARNQIRSERNRRNQQTSEVFETSEVLLFRQALACLFLLRISAVNEMEKKKYTGNKISGHYFIVTGKFNGRLLPSVGSGTRRKA